MQKQKKYTTFSVWAIKKEKNVTIRTSIKNYLLKKEKIDQSNIVSKKHLLNLTQTLK